MLMISKLDFGLAAPSPDTRGLFQNCKLRKEILFFSYLWAKQIFLAWESKESHPVP